MKKTILIYLILCSTYGFAQNNSSTITFKDGSKKQFDKVSFEYNTEDFIVGLKTKTANNDKTDISLNDVVSLRKNNVNYKTRQYKKSLYLLEEVSKSTLSLYKSGKNYFLENEEYGLKEIPRVVIDEKTLNRFDYATLSVFVNKCQEAQELAYNKNQSISISVLKDVVETFNTCNLSEDTQFATNIIELANAPSEIIEIGVNIGYSFLNTTFDDLSPGVSNNYGTPVIGAQVYFNTNMLEKRLGFIILVDYSLPKKFNSSENLIHLKSELSYITGMIGTRYTFNNISKTFSPYIGFNGGFIFNSMSSVSVQDAVFGAQLINFDSTNKLAYNLGIGSYIHFGKQKIDFNLTYQPENKFEVVSTDNLSRIEGYYKMSGFQLKATYVF
ncbi:hypothetical protein [Xanthomarina sp. F2636L]|uniref:hypothetical protein n=1 Tax=Xanthomarina sp. F2636L TaxID=2996018 RepID=UPI00225DD537|nr:hypothetical protein [Xanthomarina sp. F2636L]MCX7550039.1 hypothetical protein [Xanthomarina sp. F2636L]